MILIVSNIIAGTRAAAKIGVIDGHLDCGDSGNPVKLRG